MDTNNQRQIDKEDRKYADFMAMKEAQRERAAAWTPEEAASQAQQDAAEFREETDKTERFYKASDITANADANPHYRQALDKDAPEVSKNVAAEIEADKTVVINPAAQEQRSGAEAAQSKGVEVEPLTISQVDLDRVAATRARDTAQARESLGLNTVEPSIEKEQQQLSEAQDAQRAAWLKKAEADAPKPQADKAPGDNKVESDEIFTATQTDVKPVVPPDVEKQYLHVGNKFYHPKNTDLVAFEDKGNKLETKSNSEAIAESMVRIAEARGWDEIKVSGSETFRKEVWLEAAARGMHVKGYSPSEQDKAELAKRTSQTEANKVEKGTAQFRARENDRDRTTGPTPSEPGERGTTRPDAGQEAQQRQEDRAVHAAGAALVAHGAAKYMHEAKNNDSYYVTTRDDKGIEKTSWGVDLERAVKESGAKAGDRVLVANEGQTAVTITVPVHNKDGKLVGSEEKHTHRNAWSVQLAETFAKETPAAAVKKHPELAGAVAAVAAMDKKAHADGLSTQQRAIVMARVRQNVVNSIERGQIPEVKVKEEIEVKREVTAEKEHAR